MNRAFSAGASGVQFSPGSPGHCARLTVNAASLALKQLPEAFRREIDEALTLHQR